MDVADVDRVDADVQSAEYIRRIECNSCFREFWVPETNVVPLCCPYCGGGVYPDS